MFYYDRLYIGGGNSKAVTVSTLPANVTIVSNLNGWLEASPSGVNYNDRKAPGKGDSTRHAITIPTFCL